MQVDRPSKPNFAGTKYPGPTNLGECGRQPDRCTVGQAPGTQQPTIWKIATPKLDGTLLTSGDATLTVLKALHCGSLHPQKKHMSTGKISTRSGLKCGTCRFTTHSALPGYPRPTRPLRDSPRQRGGPRPPGHRSRVRFPCRASPSQPLPHSGPAGEERTPARTA